MNPRCTATDPPPPAGVTLRRLLVVDDAHDVPLLLRALLRRLGRTDLECIVAEDGTVGLATVLANPPHLVLCDVYMPRMDGPTLCARLRAAGYTGPVVLMTSTPHSVPPCLADAIVDKGRLLDDELGPMLDRWLPALAAG